MHTPQPASAVSLLREAVSAFAAGLKCHRETLLVTGELAHRFLIQHMTEGNPRAGGIKRLEEELSAQAGGRVKVHAIIGSHHAHRLFVAERGHAVEVPYSHLRDWWSQLLERIKPDSPAEEWVLLRGREDDCRKLFERWVQERFDRDAVARLVRDFLCKQRTPVRPGRERSAPTETQGSLLAAVAARGAVPDVAETALHMLLQTGDLSQALVALLRQAKTSGRLPASVFRPLDQAVNALLATQPAARLLTPA